MLNQYIMSRYIDFDFSTKGLAINLPNGVIKSDVEGCLTCDLIITSDISNNSITQEKLDYNISPHFIDISDNNTSNIYYPTFSSSINAQNRLYIDSNSGPLTYTPSTGVLNCLNMRSANMNDLGLFNLLRTNVQYTTIPVTMATSTISLVKGTIYFQAMYLLNSIGIKQTGIYFTNSGNGATVQMALYNKAGTLLGTSSTLTTASIVSNTLQTITWSTRPTITNIDMYYVAILSYNSATTTVTIQSSPSIPLLNVGITAPTTGTLGYVTQTYGTTGLSAFPSQLVSSVNAITTPLFMSIVSV